MVPTEVTQESAVRGKPCSAAWGKRLSLVVVLLSGVCFAQQFTANNQRSRIISGNLAPELTYVMNQHGVSPNKSIKVIVQYKQAPKNAAEEWVWSSICHFRQR